MVQAARRLAVAVLIWGLSGGVVEAACRNLVDREFLGVWCRASRSESYSGKWIVDGGFFDGRLDIIGSYATAQQTYERRGYLHTDREVGYVTTVGVRSGAGVTISESRQVQEQLPDGGVFDGDIRLQVERDTQVIEKWGTLHTPQMHGVLERTEYREGADISISESRQVQEQLPDGGVFDGDIRLQVERDTQVIEKWGTLHTPQMHGVLERTEYREGADISISESRQVQEQLPDGGIFDGDIRLQVERDWRGRGADTQVIEKVGQIDGPEFNGTVSRTEYRDGRDVSTSETREGEWFIAPNYWAGGTWSIQSDGNGTIVDDQRYW